MHPPLHHPSPTQPGPTGGAVADDATSVNDSNTTATPPLLRATNLFKTYKLGRISVPVLRGVSIDIHEGEWVAILGASGSGKSTLLHLLGGLDRPDRHNADASERGITPGQVEYMGKPITKLPGLAAMDRYRADTIGFVFQFYHLLPELNVLENVLLPAMVRHRRFGYARRAAELRKAASELLEGFGLGHRLAHRPAELSGGERQRVAVARALINRPQVVLADEPTGNLDPITGHAILDRLESRREADGFAVVMVTHDPGVAKRANRVLRLAEGQLIDV